MDNIINNKRLVKILSIVLCFCMFLSCVPSTVLAAATDTGVPCETDGCTGTYENGICSSDGSHYQAATLNGDGYYEIGNAGQLYWFAALVNGTLADVTQDNKAKAKLTADITVNPGKFDNNGNYTIDGETATPIAWTPIGTNSTGYGTLYNTGVIFDGTKPDGGNYKISGLYFNNSGTDYVGLFGETNYVTIKNIDIVNSYFKGKNYVGGFVGRSSYGTEIKNCNNAATVTGTGYIGGISGCTNGQITNCANTGSVSGTSENIGGVVGFDQRGIVTGCTNSATVSGTKCVGGIA